MSEAVKQNLIKLCIDASKNRVQNYTAQQTSEAIRDAFMSLMGTDKPNQRQFRKHAPDIFEIIEVILEQVVVDNLANNPFFEQFVEYRDLNLGDTNEFYVEDKTMLTVSKVARGTWDLRRQKLDIGDSFTVKTSTYGIKLYSDFLRVMAGRMDWNAFVAKVEQALKNKMAEEIYTNFMSTIDYLPTEFKKTGTLDEDVLMEIVDHVSVASGNSPVTIAGTKTALKKLTGTVTDYWSDSMKDEKYNTGALKMWEGIPLLVIPQIHTANTFNFAISNTRLIVLPASKPIKIVREGQSLIKETTAGTENMDMSVEYTYLTNYGIAVIFNILYGMYEMA